MELPHVDWSGLKKRGIQLSDALLASQVFIHRSYLNENENALTGSNERLEFLGDAVLELVVTDALYKRFPEKEEGELTAIRSALVKRDHLAAVAKELALGDLLLLSRGEEMSGGRRKDYILANTLEALIGALYLGESYAVAAKFIEEFILPATDAIVEKKLHVDSKSRFQELVQERHSVTPHYELLREEGPDHEKSFVMGAYIGDELVGEGQGSSKRKGEEEAAMAALLAKGWL
ncbi:ribonuclease III [Candidatus Gracilibacteria bacterium CG17_big_fil_post_rev_8_21_14_2_50_48_13]|nr:MAG: ribonuclease III [Candidatus Gracilibacteria bacterium CG17_big_fil_post_rev_8_21_14_2_50_48_13]